MSIKISKFSPKIFLPTFTESKYQPTLPSGITIFNLIHLKSLIKKPSCFALLNWNVGVVFFLFKKLKIPDDKVFIDIGSGKGRVLLIAAEFGIKEVRGIEFSPVLCEIAKKNISIYKEKTKSKTAFKIINF